MKLSRALVPRRSVRTVLIVALAVASPLIATPPIAETADRSAAPAIVAAQAAPQNAAIVSSSRPPAADGRYEREDWEVGDEEDGISQSEASIFDEGGGPGNVVRLHNKMDGRLRIKGKIELNRMHGQRVTPRNTASSFASCTDCQTVTVALQLNLYKSTATWVAPVNQAVALNVECTRCATVAVAIQYVLPVEDPNATPHDVDQLILEMRRELQDIHSDHKITVAEAETRLNSVIARFTTLSDSLNQQRAEATEQTSPTLTPTATATSSAASSATSATPDAGLPAGAAVETAATPTPVPDGAPAAAPPAPVGSPAPGP